MSPRRPATVPRTADRAVLYLRQSTYREESISLELQETACRDHCTRNAHTVIGVRSDPGVSGRKWANRPGVQEVMALATAGELDVVVIYRWSRLSRDRYDFAFAIKTLEELGVRVESATEPIDTDTAAGELSRGMLAQINAYQSDVIGEQWSEAHARRRALGLPAAGGGRYGYTVHGRKDAQRYEVDPEQAQHVEWMVQAFIDGAGFAAIARDLNARGVRNRLGRPWQRTAVKDLLDSGFAAGLIVHEPRDKAGRPTGQRIYHAGAHDAVIDSPTWQAYLAARRRRATVAPRVLEPRYPLTGLVRCGDCGSSMHPTNGGTGQAGHSYTCARWRTTGEGKCVTAVRANVERDVLHWLADLASDVDAAAAADRSADRARRRARGDTKTAARQVAELDRQLTELTRQLVAGVVPEDVYRATRDELTAARSSAAAQLADAEAAQAERPVKARQTARSLLDDWDILAVRVRRQLLAALVDRVEVHPPRLDDGKRWGRATVRVVPRWTD